ncbi:MAG: RpoL/Rpb11 RNA polymerase subunit family protein [Candidatus Norongarragalinales archaeon]
MKILSSKKNELVVSLDGMDLGFANWLVARLLEDSSVSFAAADYDHPLTANPVLRVKAEDAKKSLLKAIDAARRQVKDFEKALS